MERDAGRALLDHRGSLDAVARQQRVAVEHGRVREPVEVAPEDAPRSALRGRRVRAAAVALRESGAYVRAPDRGHAHGHKLDAGLAEARALAVDRLIGGLEVVLEPMASGAAQAL